MVHIEVPLQRAWGCRLGWGLLGGILCLDLWAATPVLPFNLQPKYCYLAVTGV